MADESPRPNKRQRIDKEEYDITDYRDSRTGNPRTPLGRFGDLPFNPAAADQKMGDDVPPPPRF